MKKNNTQSFHIIVAYMVHLLTLSGVFLGLAALHNFNFGSPRIGFIMLAISIVVDSVDGALARMFKVSHYLPHIDGTLLDNIVDFFTWCLVPAVAIHTLKLVPHTMTPGIIFLVITSSAYQFCQKEAKSDNSSFHFFRGFPCYWLYALFFMVIFPDKNETVNAAIFIILSILVFVPIKYIYPSRTKMWQKTTLFLSCLWSMILLSALFFFVKKPPLKLVLISSAIYITYYISGSLVLTWRVWKEKQQQNDNSK